MATLNIFSIVLWNSVGPQSCVSAPGKSNNNSAVDWMHLPWSKMSLGLSSPHTKKYWHSKCIWFGGYFNTRTVASLVKLGLRKKGECTHNQKDMGGPKERTLLQEYDSYLKKNMVSRIIINRCAERGTGCLQQPDLMQTWDTYCSLCRCIFCSCKSQVWKLLQQVITEKVKISTPRLSSSYKKEFKQKNQ